MNPMINKPRPGLTPLSCPRCHQPMAYINRNRPHNKVAIRCANCDFHGPDAKHVTIATLKWNKIGR